MVFFFLYFRILLHCSCFFLFVFFLEFENFYFLFYFCFFWQPVFFFFIFFQLKKHRYFGGNHVSWTAGSAITSYYADGVNYHSDALANEPKKSHLTKLHLILGENQRAMLEDSIQYGHEIYINTDGNSSVDLNIETCDETSKLQQFKLDSDLLELTNGKFCAVSTGSSDPVQMSPCDSSNSDQKWTYDDSNSLQIKSQASGKCYKSNAFFYLCFFLLLLLLLVNWH